MIGNIIIYLLTILQYELIHGSTSVAPPEVTDDVTGVSAGGWLVPGGLRTCLTLRGDGWAFSGLVSFLLLMTRPQRGEQAFLDWQSRSSKRAIDEAARLLELEA